MGVMGKCLSSFTPGGSRTLESRGRTGACALCQVPREAERQGYQQQEAGRANRRTLLIRRRLYGISRRTWNHLDIRWGSSAAETVPLLKSARAGGVLGRCWKATSGMFWASNPVDSDVR